MIEPILDSIEPIIVEELSRANLVNPPFHSSHEGIAIIEEELAEAQECMHLADFNFNMAKEHIFHDRDAEYNIQALRKQAKYAIAELVQVAAMCDKYAR